MEDGTSKVSTVAWDEYMNMVPIQGDGNSTLYSVQGEGIGTGNEYSGAIEEIEIGRPSNHSLDLRLNGQTHNQHRSQQIIEHNVIVNESKSKQISRHHNKSRSLQISIFD